MGSPGPGNRRTCRATAEPPRIGHQRRVPLEHVDGLVLPAVPMQQRRLAAGREAGQIDAEIAEVRTGRPTAVSAASPCGKRTAPDRSMVWRGAVPTRPGWRVGSAEGAGSWVVLAGRDGASRVPPGRSGIKRADGVRGRCHASIRQGRGRSAPGRRLCACPASNRKAPQPLRQAPSAPPRLHSRRRPADGRPGRARDRSPAGRARRARPPGAPRPLARIDPGRGGADRRSRRRPIRCASPARRPGPPGTGRRGR